MTLLRFACACVLALTLVLTLPGAAPARAQASLPQTTDVQGGIVRETELDRQVKAVSAELRCVVCQGLSIADSPSDLAKDMRAVVREQLELGKSPAEVKAFFVERYGEWVLLEPEPKGFNLLIYLLPIAMLVGGAAFVYFKARSLTRTPAAAP